MTEEELEEYSQLNANEQIEKVEDLVKNAGIKMADFMATSAQVMATMFAQRKEKVANSFKDTTKATAFNALLIGAILCKNNGIDSSQIIDILSDAGIQ